MKQDKTIKVAVNIDVRGKNNRRCGVGRSAELRAMLGAKGEWP